MTSMLVLSGLHSLGWSCITTVSMKWSTSFWRAGLSVNNNKNECKLCVPMALMYIILYWHLSPPPPHLTPPPPSPPPTNFRVNLLLQSWRLWESHPVPAQALTAYKKNCKRQSHRGAYIALRINTCLVGMLILTQLPLKSALSSTQSLNALITLAWIVCFIVENVFRDIPAGRTTLYLSISFLNNRSGVENDWYV